MSYEGDKYILYIVKHSDKVLNAIESQIDNKDYELITEPDIVLALDYELILNLLRNKKLEGYGIGYINEIFINPCRCVELLNKYTSNSSKVVKIELTIYNSRLAEKLFEYRELLLMNIVNTLHNIAKNLFPNNNLEDLEELFSEIEDNIAFTLDTILLLLCNVSYPREIKEKMNILSDRVYIIVNAKEKDRIEQIINSNNQ